VAYWAITLLGRAGDNAAPAVAALADILCSSAEPPVRERAAWALGKIGPTAQAARPALDEAAASDEPRLRRLAEKALEAIAG
jgi:HEAT repeat protein